MDAHKLALLWLATTVLVTGAATAYAANQRLTWDANSESNLAGYKIYFGTRSRGCNGDPTSETFTYGGGAADQGGSPIVMFLNEMADTANPSYVLVNVPDDVDFFSVTAFDTNGLESRYSDEAQLGSQGPFVCSASAPTSTTIVVAFNEFVGEASATNTANYDLRDAANNAIPITSISYDFATFKHVTLQTGALVEGESYTLRINNVQEFFDPFAAVAPNSQVSFKYTNAPNLRLARPLNHPPPQVEVEFSEAVNFTASSPASYAMNNGITITQAQKAIDRNSSDNHRNVYLTTSALTEGTTYTVTVSNVEDDFGNVIAPGSTVNFTVPTDTSAPIPLSAHVTAPLRKRDEVHVAFSEEVDPVTAGDPLNYDISGDIAVDSASLFGDNKTVVLKTTSHPDGNYTISISGVKDSSVAGNPMTPRALSYRVVDAITDTDGDGREDVRDNCILVPNPDQRDTDKDRYGNVCDADFDNNEIVNALDLGVFKSRFASRDPDADINGDGIVNALDLGLLKRLFGKKPGPSGLRR